MLSCPIGDARSDVSICVEGEHASPDGGECRVVLIFESVVSWTLRQLVAL